MDFSLQADQSIVTWEPLRKILDPPKAPGRVRIGPDWTTLAGNWFVKWERTVSAYTWHCPCSLQTQLLSSER